MADDFASFLQSQGTPKPDASQTQTDVAGPTPTPAPALADPFQKFLMQAKGQQDTLAAAAQTTVANASTPAATAGKAAQVGRQLGVPQQAVETNLPSFEQQAKIKQNTDLLEQNPVLAKWVAANPDAARVAQDEYGNLSTIEKLWDGSKDIAYAGVQQLGASFAQAGLAVNRSLGSAFALPGQNPLSDWWQQHMVAPMAQNTQALQLPEDATFGQKTAGAVGQMLGMLSQIEASGTGGIGQAAEAGAGVLSTIAGAAQQAAKSMAFPSFTQAVNTGQDVFNKTQDNWVATRAGLATYLMTTLQGMVPFSVPGGIAKRIASGAVANMATSEGQRAAMNLLMPDSMQQQFDPQAMLLQGVQGAMMAGFMGPRAEPHTYDAIRQTYTDALKAETAERDMGKVATLGQIAAKSQLRESDPDAFHDFVRTVTDNSDLDAVYVKADVLQNAFAQSGISADLMPEVRDQLGEAVTTGGDVRIPIADYATHIAGTPMEKAILPEMKAAPDGLTFKEGQAFYQQAAKNLTERAKALADQRQQSAEMDADKAQVHQQVLDQLTQAGRFPDAVNGGYASLISEAYATLAERAGMKPSELFKQNPLTIGAEGTGAGLAQGERGAYDPATHSIALLKNADLSTFLHESGHHFLELMHSIASGDKAPEGIKTDFDTLLQSFGEKGATPEERLANWSTRDLEGKRAGHEQFAGQFERYLMEGKAPSMDMQSMFGRFRSWMLNVYQSLKNAPGIEISPEVRGVFDRLLASDTAIKQAQETRGYMPLFSNEKEAGMTMQQFNDYLAMGEQATNDATNKMDQKSLADMKWLSGAKSKALAALQRQADAARKQTRAEVENEVSAMPAIRAADYMRENGGPGPEHKEAMREWTERRDSQTEKTRDAIKAELLKDSTGTGLEKAQLVTKNKRAMENEVERQMLEWEKQNPKPALQITRPDADMVGQMFGFKDGDEMRQAIMDTGSKKDLIDMLTDQRMLEEHGELTNPEALEDAANAAVHNEARARFMATGLKALTDSPIPASQIARAAKEAAERTIAGKVVGAIKPSDYLAAEARANKEALAAAAKDPKAAIEAQRAAILNNRLAKVAQDVKEEIQKGLDYLKKFDKPSVAKAIGFEYMDRINELLSRYDISNRFNTQSDVEARASMREWLDSEFARTGIRPEVSDAMADFVGQQHWKEMTVENFRGLVDAVRSLEHVGRDQTTLMIDGQRMQLDELVQQAKDSMATMPHSPPVDVQAHLQHATGLDKLNAQWMALKGKVRSMDAAILKMEQLFQWLDSGSRSGLGEAAMGAFNKVFRRISGAEAAERAMRAESVKEIQALRDKLKDANVNIHESINVPELPREGRGAQYYREELLAMTLNTGNESNLQKLSEGYGWRPDQVQRALDRILTKPEWDFVQGIWDSVGKYGPQIEALQKRLTGVGPEMIQPQAVRTRHGVYDGGYYPVVYDGFADSHIEDKQAKNADMLFENQWSKPTTSKGHTVNRTGYVGPIHLSLGVIARHLDQVTHDLAWREAIIDSNKFLSDPRIKSEIDQVMGREYTKQLRPWLQALANDKVFNTSGDSGWENFYRKARSNATMVGLGFRLSTMEVHGMSALSTSLGEVGAKWMAKGAAQFAGIDRWGNARDFVFARSPEMANRMNEMDRNVHEAIDQINEHSSSFAPASAAQKVVDNAKKFAFYGVSMLDMASAMPTWYGAYLKGMAKAGDGGMNMSEADAVEYANRAVRNAHGGGGTKDLAAVQRDKGAMSLATMFYSFWNHMYNRQRDLMAGYSNLPDSFKQGTGTKDFAKLLARSWYYFAVPQLIHALIKPDPQDEKDDDGSVGHFLGHVGKEVGLGFVSGVPVLRDLANAAVNGHDYTVTPLEQAGKTLVRAVQGASQMAQGEPMNKPVKTMGEAAGYTFGLPTGQASTAAQFLWDVYNGDSDPESVKDWYQGVTSGRMSR